MKDRLFLAIQMVPIKTEVNIRLLFFESHVEVDISINPIMEERGRHDADEESDGRILFCV